MNKTTNTATRVLQSIKQLKGDFDATDTRPRARVKDGVVKIFTREKSNESLGERVANHLARHTQRANAVQLVEAIVKDVENILAPLASKDIQATLDTEHLYLQSVRPTNKGMLKTIESLEALLKENTAVPAPTRASTRAPKTVRPRLQTRTSKATRPAWGGKGPSTVAGRATDRPVSSKTTPPKMTKRSVAPSGRAAVATTVMPLHDAAVPARSSGKLKPLTPLRTAATDLASQWPAVKAFAAKENDLDWAGLLSHVLISSPTDFDDYGRALTDSTAMNSSGVKAFQKFLRQVDGMGPEGINAEWKKLNAEENKSAKKSAKELAKESAKKLAEKFTEESTEESAEEPAEKFTAAEKMGILRFASQLAAHPTAVAPFPWVPGVRAIAKIVVAEPAPPSTRAPRPVR
jgi:hypothetical protein